MKAKAPKVTVDGATWKRFYSDPKLWNPPGVCYHEDEVFWVDGQLIEDRDGMDMEKVADTAQVAVVSGTYCDKDGDYHDFVDVFRDWVKAHGIETATVSKAKLDALELCYQALVSMHGKGPFRDDTEATRAILAVQKAAGA